MDLSQKILAGLAAAFLLLALIRVFQAPLRLALKLLVNTLLGFLALWAVNLTAAFDLSQLAAREFLKKEKPYGKIINIASMLSFFGGQTVPAYAASKGGVAQFSKCMCNELAGKGININCIAPGYMATDMNTALTDPANPRFKIITDRIPAGRWGTGEDMKGAAIFLASRASDYLDGAVIPVDGGYLVK